MAAAWAAWVCNNRAKLTWEASLTWMEKEKADRLGLRVQKLTW